jgi:hypothetical protein
LFYFGKKFLGRLAVVEKPCHRATKAIENKFFKNSFPQSIVLGMAGNC